MHDSNGRAKMRDRIRFPRAMMSVGAALAAIVLISCGGQEDAADGSRASAREVELVCLDWMDGIALANLAAAVLEERMDCSVALTTADAETAFQMVATGEKDALTGVWLPVTHPDEMRQYGEKLVDLGANYAGARVGLAVPAYVDAEMIAELDNVGRAAGGRIVGPAAGDGILKGTRQAIAAYDLELNLVPASAAETTDVLDKAFKERRPAVIASWKPHWRLAQWDLKFLDDPKKIYGETEDIHTVINASFRRNMPDVTACLTKIRLDDTQMASLMYSIHTHDGDPANAVRTWLRENEAAVERWLP